MSRPLTDEEADGIAKACLDALNRGALEDRLDSAVRIGEQMQRNPEWKKKEEEMDRYDAAHPLVRMRTKRSYKSRRS